MEALKEVVGDAGIGDEDDGGSQAGPEPGDALLAIDGANNVTHAGLAGDGTGGPGGGCVCLRAGGDDGDGHGAEAGDQAGFRAHQQLPEDALLARVPRLEPGVAVKVDEVRRHRLQHIHPYTLVQPG